MHIFITNDIIRPISAIVVAIIVIVIRSYYKRIFFKKYENKILDAIANGDQKTAYELVEKIKKKQPLTQYFDKAIDKYEEKFNSSEK